MIGRIVPSGALLQRWDIDGAAHASLPFDRALALINLKRIELACWVGLLTDLLSICFGRAEPALIVPLPLMIVIAIASRRTLHWTSLRAQQTVVLAFFVAALAERMVVSFALTYPEPPTSGYAIGALTMTLLFVLRPLTLAIIQGALLVPFAAAAAYLLNSPAQAVLVTVNAAIVAGISTVAGALIHGARHRDFTQKRLIHSQNAQLIERNEELDQLMAIAAHDLRSPLYGLRNLLDLATRRAPEHRDVALKAVRDGIFSIDAMLTLVTRLLDAHSAEHAPLTAQVREDLRGQILAAARRISPAAEAAGCSIAIDVPNAPLIGRFDRGALIQVLDNLLSNAVRFGPAGGCVHLTGSVHAGRVTIEIADQGPGLDADARQRLFLKFANAGLSRSKAGAGMGLFIAATFTDRMGATLSFRDAEPTGAIFKLTLAS
ncbi:HAMP domain-containing sensor histidine kinase [Sphingomonas sp. ZT3P38]|uniref:sensor histidine kinase n=1 Tax=Parasphingomonas zepuensis TaxID=3096161 RepID=UPI002FC65DA9